MQTKNRLQSLAYLAVLTAVQIVLSRFCSISTYHLKIGFSFLPVALGAVLMGPLGGAVVAGLGDFLGAILFPIGPYFPGFTLTSAIGGALYGVALRKKEQRLRGLIAVVLFNQLVLGLLVNTLWISLLYGTPYEVLLGTRVWQCCVMIPVEIFAISALMGVLPRIRKQVQ